MPKTSGSPLKGQNDNSLKELPMTTKIPSLATRRASCTHVTMERLYGDHLCNVCHEPSRLGWVYCCIQDDDEDPGSESLSNSHERPDLALVTLKENGSKSKRPTNDTTSTSGQEENTPGLRMPKIDLAPWMELAISQGEYTEEQIKVLRAQKQHVVDVANGAIEQFEREVQSKDTQLFKVGSASYVGTVNAIVTKMNESIPPLRSKLFPYCKFRACQACRPMFRDRAWERLDTVLATGRQVFDQSMIHELPGFGRPNSCEVTKAIGLRTEDHPILKTHCLKEPRPGSMSENDLCLYGSNDPGNAKARSRRTTDVPCTDVAFPGTQDVADPGLELNSKSSRVRESVDQLCGGGLNRSRSSRRIKRRKTALESYPTTVISLCNTRDETLLNEAASMPLPRSESIDRSQRLI